MITFHASADGGHDYLDLHTPDGARFYLDRDEARRLASDILTRAANDVVCPHCDRLNGVHSVNPDCPALAEKVRPSTVNLAGVAVELDPSSPQAAVESWRGAQ